MIVFVPNFVILFRRSGGSLPIYYHTFNDLRQLMEEESQTSMSKTGYSSGQDLSRLPRRWAE